MGKYVDKKPASGIPPVKAADDCGRCGWHFPQSGESVPVDLRGRPIRREQINLSLKSKGEVIEIIVRCGPCYILELESLGKAQGQDGLADRIEVMFAKNAAVTRTEAHVSVAARCWSTGVKLPAGVMGHDVPEWAVKEGEYKSPWPYLTQGMGL
jgi:hypothetical protein